MTQNEFVPFVMEISNITKGQTTLIEFESEHNFFMNEIVSFRVSKPYGMIQLNRQSGKVINLTSLSITVDIDSLGYDSFITPASLLGTTPPCAVPSASGVDFSSYAPTVILTDSFDNRPTS